MTLKRALIAGALVALVAVGMTLGINRAAAGGSGSQATQAIRATNPLHNLAKANAAGYAVVVKDITGASCIAQAGAGGMGVHYLNPGLLDDRVDAATPEALVFAPTASGKQQLVALEYIAFKDVWDATHSKPPSLFGQKFLLTPSPNRFGIPAFYSQHLWIWKFNPTGMLKPWNPQVSCPS